MSDPQPGARRRALVLCPGRGSYGRDTRGQLQGRESHALDVFDAERAKRGLPTVRALDAAPQLRPDLHVAGEHASGLTAAFSLADAEQINLDLFDIVGVCGNSMGWYTALGLAGALPLEDCATLVETFGGWQADNVIGGQVIVPLTGDDWRPEAWRVERVDALIAAIPGLSWSIRLGGQAVLGGTEAALRALSEALPAEDRGGIRFPLRLPLHSAFHTPLMAEASRRSQALHDSLDWRAPRVPMIDGSGQLWSPYSADPRAISAWTLGAQVTDAFDFTAMVTTALGELAPEVIIVPGPGDKLGSAIAQVMIRLGWQGIHDRAGFMARQKASPIVLSMGRADQRAVVTG